MKSKMKSAILYPYGPLTGTGCCRLLHAKNMAITSAIYTVNISILIVLIYAWRISVNIRRSGDLEDVYYGVQIAYFAIIGTQISMIVLSIMLMFGIYKENPGLIVPWIIGFITFMALEAVAMVYSNVLRDHVNKQFDAMCKAEVAFFVARAFINYHSIYEIWALCCGSKTLTTWRVRKYYVLSFRFRRKFRFITALLMVFAWGSLLLGMARVVAMWGVTRFYNLVRAGITWRGPEARTSGQGRGRGRGLSSGDDGAGVGGVASAKTIGCFSFDYEDYDYDEGEYGDEEDVDDDDDYEEYNENSDDDVISTEPGKLGCQNTRAPRGYRSSFKQGQRYPRRNDNGGVSGQNNNKNNNNARIVVFNKRHNKYKITHQQSQLEVIDELEKSIGSGSDENDSLLVAYDSNSGASV